MNNEIGIVLAGGTATRMPNKLLLPTRTSGCLVFNSIRFLKNQGLRVVVSIVKNETGRLLKTIISREYSFGGVNGIEFVEDGEPRGVVYAIHHVMDEIEADQYVVACGDNIYPMQFSGSNPSDGDTLICRLLPRNRAEHLVTYNPERKCFQRGVTPDQDSKSYICVTTPWYLKRRQLRSQDVVEFFNEIQPNIHLVESPGWWDLGTMDQYLEYWNVDR